MNPHHLIVAEFFYLARVRRPRPKLFLALNPGTRVGGIFDHGARVFAQHHRDRLNVNIRIVRVVPPIRAQQESRSVRAIELVEAGLSLRLGYGRGVDLQARLRFWLVPFHLVLPVALPRDASILEMPPTNSPCAQSGDSHSPPPKVACPRPCRRFANRSDAKPAAHSRGLRFSVATLPEARLRLPSLKLHFVAEFIEFWSLLNPAT